MEPLPVPSNIKATRPDCRLVQMGPPSGVSGRDVGTAEMLISDVAEDIPGYPARRQYVYFRPSPEQIQQLSEGGCIEFCQYGHVVQPFSAVVWPAPEEPAS